MSETEPMRVYRRAQAHINFTRKATQAKSVLKALQAMSFYDEAEGLESDETQALLELVEECVSDMARCMAAIEV